MVASRDQLDAPFLQDSANRNELHGAGLKYAILIAALFTATAVHAQSIKKIARYGDHTVALSDMPCPIDEYSSRTAIYNAYGGSGGSVLGCWVGEHSKTLTFRWLKNGTDRELPGELPSKDFETVE